MTRSKVKVTEVQNLPKWSISKSVISSADMHVIAVNDTPRQYLNFNQTNI